VSVGSDATNLDLLAINTIRGLCMDEIEKANSGHPGTPMGIAPVVYTLWQNHLMFDPDDPIWPNRDRFVLSEGHASSLLWALLQLARVQAVNPDYETTGREAVTMEDLKTFRQLGSHCPGHPEYHLTSGVEATTGPLGQGVATSVGMAIAGRWLAARYNVEGLPIFDFSVYALAGDGCMMEGISSEAASLAGHLGLSNLCWIYDSNRVTIEGHTDITFTEDTAARFIAYNWNVTTVADANDMSQIERAIHSFQKEEERPTLILVHSHIGYGSPVEDSPKAHGEPFGPEGVKSTKHFFGLPDVDFYVPDGMYDWFSNGVGARGRAAQKEWSERLEEYRGKYPALAREIDLMQHREVPDGWDSALPTFPADPVGLATRDSSSQVINAVASQIPWLVGGSADLTPSTKTRLSFEGAGDFEPGDPSGRNLHFGIREHASAAISNGMALTKLRPFWSGFLIFSDYARGAIRLSSLMELPVLHIFTHDSIGVGEDGPTHQPVEQLVGLRSIPGMLVFRPADANEVVETWRAVMALRHEPAAIVLSRQALPTIDRELFAPATGVARGAYVLAEPEGGGKADVILMATGSEVHLALDARADLQREGIGARVVSMPCTEIFDMQSDEYRLSVIPTDVRARVAIEQASTLGWDRYVGDGGAVVGMHTFGASAPLKQLLNRFGFTPERVCEVAMDCVAKSREERK
jgi:transketolase